MHQRDEEPTATDGANLQRHWGLLFSVYYILYSFDLRTRDEAISEKNCRHDDIIYSVDILYIRPVSPTLNMNTTLKEKSQSVLVRD